MRRDEWETLKTFEGKTIVSIEPGGFHGNAVTFVCSEEVDTGEVDGGGEPIMETVESKFTITSEIERNNPLALEVQFTRPHTF